MRSSIERDRRLRQIVRRREVARRTWRTLRAEGSLAMKARQRAVAGLALEPRDASATRVVNRCLETARGRGVLRLPSISRIILRDATSRGL